MTLQHSTFRAAALTVLLPALAHSAPIAHSAPAARSAAPRTRQKQAHNMTILDPQHQLDRWKWRDNMDDDWFKTHIPFWESPDAEIDATYYYRWELATKHLVYGSPESGYNFTEFIDRPSWSGKYGSISCPLGLQLYEARWLRDGVIAGDYARYWFSTPGAQPRSYSNWYGDALWANYLVSGDKAFITSLLPSMEAQYQGWMKEHWRPAHAMFAWSGMHDGMEFTIGSRQTKDQFAGAESYRPTLNSYVFGDLNAIANTAQLAGDTAKASTYRQKAAQIKARVQDELWDARRQFFLSQFADDEEKDGTRYGRGAGLSLFADGTRIASTPQMGRLSAKLPARPTSSRPSAVQPSAARLRNFAVNNDGAYYPRIRASFSAPNTSVGNLVDGNYYYHALRPVNRWTSEGSTGASETLDVDFGVARPLENVKLYLLDDGAGRAVRAPAAFDLQFWDGAAWQTVPQQRRTPAQPQGHRPNIVAFPALRASRLRVVLKPQPGASLGLTELEAWGRAPLPLPPAPVMNNLARTAQASASFTSHFDTVEQINDGQIEMSGGRNRWTAFESPNASDWVQLDWKEPITVSRVELCLWGDGGGVRVPRSFTLQSWNGTAWVEAREQVREPAQPTLLTPNEISIEPVRTTRLRVTFAHAMPGQSGVSEWLVWGPGKPATP